MTAGISNQPGPARPAVAPDADPREPAVLFSLLIATLFGAYLLLTSTTTLIPGIWPYDTKRILQFALLFTLFLIPALNGRIRIELSFLLTATPTWIKFALLAVFSWGALSALINAQSVMHALNSLSEVALLFVLVLGVFVVAACRRVAGRLFDRVAIGLLALTGLAVGMQELLGVIAAYAGGVDFNFSVSLLHFSWPRFYNQVQSWIIPVLVALPIVLARYRLAAILCLLVLGLQWYIILMTGARGSFVSIGAAIILISLFVPQVRQRLLTWQLAGFVFGALLFILVMFIFEEDSSTEHPDGELQSGRPVVVREADRMETGPQISGGESSFFKQSVGRPLIHTSGRTWMWPIAINDARQHPFVGIGPMNYVCLKSQPINHPHNFVLQLAAEWGLPVAVLICTLSGFLFWRTTQRLRNHQFGPPENELLAGLLLTGLLAAALHACLSGVLVMPASQTAGLLIGGMLLGLCPAVPQGKQVARRYHWGFIPGLILCCYLLALGSYELTTMDRRAEMLTPGESKWPRIWQDAKVCQLYNEQNTVKN